MASQVNITGKNIMLDTLGSACGYMALYTDIAGTTEVTGGSYARKTIAWNSASGGSKSISNQPVFDVPAGTTVNAIGFCTALTGGVQHAVDDVIAESYASAGTYTVTSSTISM